MKKIIVFLFAMLVLLCVFGLFGCKKGGNGSGDIPVKGETIDMDVNYKSIIDLTQYFTASDNVANVKMYGVDGKRISIGYGDFYAEQTGTYKLVLNSGSVYNFHVKDIAGPYAKLSGQDKTVNKGDTVKLNVELKDNSDKTPVLNSVTVTKNGENINIAADNSFVAEKLGVYNVRVIASDNLGNVSETDIELTSVFKKENIVEDNYVYQISPDNFDGVLDDAKTYDFSSEVYEITKSGRNKVNVESFIVKNNRMYEIYQYAVCGEERHELSYFFRTDNMGYVSFNDGDMSKVIISSEAQCVFSAELKDDGEANKALFNTTKPNGGSWYRVSFGGLEKNTTYASVSLKIDIRETSESGISMSFHTSTDKSAFDIAFGIAKKNVNYVSMTTDDSGYVMLPMYIYGSDLKFTIDDVCFIKENIFGETIYPAGLGIKFEGAEQEEVLLTEGENAGKYVHQANWNGGRSGTFTVYATFEAGLLANTDYVVRLEAEVDGAFPAFYDIENSGNPAYFLLSAPGGEIVINVTTDANGEFGKTYRVYYNEGNYARINGITCTRNGGSIYGEGVRVSIGNMSGTNVITSCDTEKMFTEGENVGYTRTYATSSGSANCAMSVELIGHKANTRYTVYLTIETDGSWPALIGPGDCFVIGSPSGNTDTVEIVTDENGYGAYSWNGIYAQNATYFDVVGATITEA